MQNRSIHLVPITELKTDAQLAILDIRNHPEVRKVMYTDRVIGVNEHLRWISRLKTDTGQIVFGILLNDGPIGAVNFQELDLKNKRSEWGFYLSPKERGRGIGTAVERRFIEFAFETLGLEKLNGTVEEGNDAILRLHKRFGFEEEGFRRSDIVKDGRRIGIHFIGLQKKAWVQNQMALYEAHKKVFEQFPIEIHWPPEKKSLTPIDQIEAARARNNVNWMNILRIAVEKSPVNAKQIIADIKEIDEEISMLTAQITVDL